MTTPTPTPDIATLLAIYEKHQQVVEKKRAYLQTPEGKENNRLKSAIFYERNRERVLQKRRQMYEENKEEMRTRNREYARKRKAEAAKQEGEK